MSGKGGKSLAVPAGGKKKVKASSKSEKAGLTFPVGRIGRYLKAGRYAKRIGGGAPIFLASVLEYLCAEVLELAGNVAQENQKLRISPRHIQLAVRQDDELNEFLGNVTIASGGVMPTEVNYSSKGGKGGKGGKGTMREDAASDVSDE
ncbi:MAG: uncharacterized protein KVP18_002679 [Porospora cf. gigantea A]|uniref:uncharacterized protein n=1 Tax=Porospora cf. gigantea A TaxID=2853593 RepID=UPI003559AFFC|nr:MAG: hypothetical protein KVP18_002679 [Porospora cf. gigantea A]